MSERIHFHAADRYTIDGSNFHYVDADDAHGFFRREDGSQAIERFSWERLKRLAERGRLLQERRTTDLVTARHIPDRYACIWELPTGQRDLILIRWFFVNALLQLYQTGVVKKTKASARENYERIRALAAKECAAFQGSFTQKYFSSAANGFAHDASPSSILSWTAIYEKTGRLDALMDRRGRKAKLDIGQESYRFLIQHLREFLTLQRCGKALTVDRTLMALKAENHRRQQEGQRPLEGRGRTTLFDWINRFDPFEIEVARHGLIKARRKFAAVGQTERATRPGQTFQVDEWEIDARSVILNGPIREGLDENVINRLPKTRRWLYVVIDVATR